MNDQQAFRQQQLMNVQLQAQMSCLGGAYGSNLRQDCLLDVLRELAQERALRVERHDLNIPEPKGTAERVASLRVKAKLLLQEEQRVELEQARRLVEELRGRQEKLDEAQRRVKELEDSLKAP